jgi:hypothetical protein
MCVTVRPHGTAATRACLAYRPSVAAKLEPIVVMIPILEASMLALRIPAGIPLSRENPFGVSADKKALLAASGDWTFTYTPTIAS